MGVVQFGPVRRKKAGGDDSGRTELSEEGGRVICDLGSVTSKGTPRTGWDRSCSITGEVHSKLARPVFLGHYEPLRLPSSLFPHPGLS